MGQPDASDPERDVAVITKVNCGLWMLISRWNNNTVLVNYRELCPGRSIGEKCEEQQHFSSCALNIVKSVKICSSKKKRHDLWFNVTWISLCKINCLSGDMRQTVIVHGSSVSVPPCHNIIPGYTSLISWAALQLSNEPFLKKLFPPLRWQQQQVLGEWLSSFSESQLQSRPFLALMYFHRSL